MMGIEQRRARIHADTLALREYRAMPETKLFIALLDSLAADILEDLATVQADQLKFKQGALAQVRALRLAISSDDPDQSAIA
jgi:hypothetical protein